MPVARLFVVPLKRRPAVGLMGLAVWMLLVAGCKTIDVPLLSQAKTPSIDGIEGPTQRNLRSFFRKRDNQVGDPNAFKPIAGTEDYLAAEELYRDGRYAEAQKAFRKVATKFKKSEIREDALFMEAECAMELGHYSHAYDKYGDLLKAYPSSTHLDQISKNLFKIAKTWLSYPEMAQLNEIQQANLEEPGKPIPAPKPVEDHPPTPLKPNFFDQSKPLFDPEGNGIAALRAIWLNDPTGPLADDALMLAASHYARRGKWVESDRYFSMLREEYPQSQHVQAAFVIGSHVKLMSYEGDQYEARPLEDAKQLKLATAKLFGDRIDKDRIEKELKQIAEARARRDWSIAEFYMRKNKPNAVAIQCHLVIDRHPDTSYAERAKIKLRELGPQYADGSKFKIAPPPPKPFQIFPPLPPVPVKEAQQTDAPDLQPVPNEPADRWKFFKKTDPKKVEDGDIPKAAPGKSPFPNESEESPASSPENRPSPGNKVVPPEANPPGKARLEPVSGNDLPEWGRR